MLFLTYPFIPYHDIIPYHSSLIVPSSSNRPIFTINAFFPLVFVHAAPSVWKWHSACPHCKHNSNQLAWPTLPHDVLFLILSFLTSQAVSLSFGHIDLAGLASNVFDDSYYYLLYFLEGMYLMFSSLSWMEFNMPQWELGMPQQTGKKENVERVLATLK